MNTTEIDRRLRELSDREAALRKSMRKGLGADAYQAAQDMLREVERQREELTEARSNAVSNAIHRAARR